MGSYQPPGDTPKTSSIAAVVLGAGHGSRFGGEDKHRLEENLGAVGLTLTTEDLTEIAAALTKIEVQGERLPEAVLKMTGL